VEKWEIIRINRVGLEAATYWRKRFSSLFLFILPI